MTLELAQLLIGKRVQVKGNTPPELYGGILTFIGPNPYFPSWGIQATISRMPISNIDLNSLKEIKCKTIFNK